MAPQPDTSAPAPCPPKESLGATVDLRTVTPASDGRLPVTPVTSRIDFLAAQESQKGLVDEGGVFAFEEGAAVLCDCHPHGFIAAATAAWAGHHPLAVRPQHFWLMILQGIAVHVEQNAEELRKLWVAHEGKKELEVRCDEFVLGAKNDWASVVDGKPDCFSVQIDRNVVAGVAEELSPNFTNTTPAENISLKICVMAITKSFFSFKCSTMCGFPFVIMEGSADDWQLLRTNAELLIKNRCLQAFAEEWCAALLPLLDMLVQEYTKAKVGEQPDEPFWNSMCKRGGTSGSGARTWFNGWINILFPFIKERPNRYLVAYSADNGYVKEGRQEKFYGMRNRMEDNTQGPDCEDFPTGLAAAPVLWDYLGKEVKLKFKAGFVGAQQEQVTGIVKPMVGWFIAHDGGGGEDNGPKAKGKGKGKPAGFVLGGY